jgi:hypothetical protein
MRTTTAMALSAAALLAALTACAPESSPTPPAAKPAPAPPLSQAEIAEKCTDAVAARISGPAGTNAYEPRPAPCSTLTERAYQVAYLRGLQRANQASRDELERKIDEAARRDGR